jgi:hypothetical protein
MRVAHTFEVTDEQRATLARLLHPNRKRLATRAEVREYLDGALLALSGIPAEPGADIRAACEALGWSESRTRGWLAACAVYGDMMPQG